jgi:hypothetical protein
VKTGRNISFLPAMNRAQRGLTHEYVTNYYLMESMSYDAEPNRSIVIYHKPEARLPKVLLSTIAWKIKSGELDKPVRPPVVASLLFYQL